MSAALATRLAWGALGGVRRTDLGRSCVRLSQPFELRRGHDRVAGRQRVLPSRSAHVLDRRGARRLPPTREPDRLDLPQPGSDVRDLGLRKRVRDLRARRRAGGAAGRHGDGLGAVLALPGSAHPERNPGLPPLPQRPSSLAALAAGPLGLRGRDRAGPARGDVLARPARGASSRSRTRTQSQVRLPMPSRSSRTSRSC